MPTPLWRAQVPSRTVAPAAPLLTVEQCRAHVALLDDENDDDALISAYVDAVVSKIDAHAGTLGRCLINQTWEQKGAGFPGDNSILLPYPDVSSCTVAYIDTDAVSQTFAAANWRLVETPRGSAVELDDSASWPSTDTRPDAVTLTFVAGYGTSADDVPAAIRHAGLMLAAHYYESREAVVTGTITAVVPLGAEALLAPYRRHSFGA